MLQCVLQHEKNMNQSHIFVFMIGVILRVASKSSTLKVWEPLTELLHTYDKMF